MRKIAKPTLDISEIITDCISNMTNENLKEAIEEGLSQIIDAESEYDEKKAENRLYEIVRDKEISLLVNKDELKKIYKDRFSKSKHLARKYYDLLLFSAPGSRCPQCAVRIATTLDHNLPKSKYPLLAVSPLNLIPSCSDCNKGKHIEYPTCSEEETIHPYYDDIEETRWLYCKVITVKPFLVSYYVKTEHPPLMNQRIINHFESFQLNKLYTIHAAEAFSNDFGQLKKLFLSGGRDELLAQINDNFESCAQVNINSWQCTYYEGLLDCEDFLNGHFI